MSEPSLDAVTMRVESALNTHAITAVLCPCYGGYSPHPLGEHTHAFDTRQERVARLLSQLTCRCITLTARTGSPAALPHVISQIFTSAVNAAQAKKRPSAEAATMWLTICVRVCVCVRAKLWGKHQRWCAKAMGKNCLHHDISEVPINPVSPPSTLLPKWVVKLRASYLVAVDFLHEFARLGVPQPEIRLAGGARHHGGGAAAWLAGQSG
jgi:hypothetical protein